MVVLVPDWPGAAGSGGRWHPPGEPEQRRSAGALEGAPGSGPKSSQIRRDRLRWELVYLNGVEDPERPRGGTGGRIHPAREAGTGQNLLTSTASGGKIWKGRPAAGQNPARSGVTGSGGNLFTSTALRIQRGREAARVAGSTQRGKLAPARTC